MLVHVNPNGRIEICPEGRAPFDYEGDERRIIYLGDSPEKRAQEAKSREQNERGIFVVLHGTGQYSGFDPARPDDPRWPFRVDMPCSLGQETAYSITGGSNLFDSTEWLIYAYRLRVDTSDVLAGEGSYDEWPFEFQSIAYTPDYKGKRIITGEIALVLENGYTWSVRITSPREANSVWVFAPTYHDDRRR